MVVGGGWWWLKAALVFIFGPNLKNKTLLGPRPKLKNITSHNTYGRCLNTSSCIYSSNYCIELKGVEY